MDTLTKNFTDLVAAASESTDIAFEIPNMPAVIANFVVHTSLLILRDFFVAMIVYAYFMEKMWLFMMKKSKNWHSLSLKERFWPRLLQINWVLGAWALLFAFVSFSWDPILDLGLVFEPVPIKGTDAVSCLVWSNEGPETVGDVLPVMSRTFTYERRDPTEGNNSVGSTQDKELLRRSIAEGSFGLMSLPTLTGGDAIELSGGFSPRDFYYGKEGLLTFYKSVGVNRDYNPDRRTGGKVEYGAYTVYSPTIKTFGGEEKVAQIHGIGSIRVRHDKKTDACYNKLQQIASDAYSQGTDTIKWDSFMRSENCTGTLLVRSQDLGECISHYEGDYNFTLEKLIGAVKIFSNHSGETIDKKTTCKNDEFRFDPESRVVLVKTNKTEDLVMMEPYIRALARDAYTSSKETISLPETLSDRDALRVVRILADIMSDEYRFRPDFCPDIKIEVYLGFRWLWVIILVSAMVFFLISTVVAYYVGKDVSVRLSELQENTVWFEAGTIKDAEEITFNVVPKAAESCMCQAKSSYNEWCQAFRFKRDEIAPESDGQFEFKLAGGGEVVVRKSQTCAEGPRVSIKSHSTA